MSDLARSLQSPEHKWQVVHLQSCVTPLWAGLTGLQSVRYNRVEAAGYCPIAPDNETIKSSGGLKLTNLTRADAEPSDHPSVGWAHHSQSVRAVAVHPPGGSPRVDTIRRRQPWSRLLLLMGLAITPWSACADVASMGRHSTKPQPKRKAGALQYNDHRKPGPGEPLLPLAQADRLIPSEIESQPPTAADALCDSSPVGSLWRTPVTDWPIHPQSEQWLTSIGQELPLNLDANHTVYDVRESMIPVLITIRSPSNSDAVPWYIPSDAEPFRPLNTHGRPRMLVLDHVHCRSYEFFGVAKTEHGWKVDTANAFDLRVRRRRRVGWFRETEGTTVREYSHDASGASVLAGLLRVGNLEQEGGLEHALGVSVPALDRAYLPPATHGASSLSNPSLPPSGVRLRLRDRVDCSLMASSAQQVCTAMKQYGLVVTSQGPTLALTGEVMSTALYRSLSPLSSLTAGDFDVVGSDLPTRYGTTSAPFLGRTSVGNPKSN